MLIESESLKKRINDLKEFNNMLDNRDSVGFIDQMLSFFLDLVDQEVAENAIERAASRIKGANCEDRRQAG